MYIFASNGSGIYNTSIKVIIQICIETNIRQRGIGNPNPIKLSRCIKELERIYGVREGSANQKGNNRIGEPKVSDDQLTQSDIAEMIGISVDTLNNYKKLTELIPELEDCSNVAFIRNFHCSYNKLQEVII